MISSTKISDKLPQVQGTLRLRLLDLYFSVHAGHIGCSLSCVDMMISALINQKKEEDTFILSKGHAAAALYVCLNYLGEISDIELNTFYKNGTTLSAHPAPHKFKSIPFSTGSLGHGFPIGAGIAKANKLLKNNSLVYVLMSDGETNEGTCWEASHFATHHRLDNLIIMIDKNGLQGFGNTKNILGDTASHESWKSLGFDLLEIDGHDLVEIDSSINKLKLMRNGKPKLIIGNTIKGKGISYMESKMEWHYLPMNEVQYIEAKNEIIEKYIYK